MYWYPSYPWFGIRLEVPSSLVFTRKVNHSISLRESIYLYCRLNFAIIRNFNLAEMTIFIDVFSLIHTSILYEIFSFLEAKLFFCYCFNFDTFLIIETQRMPWPQIKCHIISNLLHFIWCDYFKTKKVFNGNKLFCISIWMITFLCFDCIAIHFIHLGFERFWFLSNAMNRWQSIFI